MTDFVYKYLKPTYHDKATICYTDTESIICSWRPLTFTKT